MKQLFKQYWVFLPLIIIVSITFLLILFAVVGDIYSYLTIYHYDYDNLKSDNNYDDSINDYH